jgi:hypothetical protein
MTSQSQKQDKISNAEHNAAEDSILSAFRKAEAGGLFGMGDERSTLYEKMARLNDYPTNTISVDPEQLLKGPFPQ